MHGQDNQSVQILKDTLSFKCLKYLGVDLIIFQ